MLDQQSQRKLDKELNFVQLPQRQNELKMVVQGVLKRYQLHENFKAAYLLSKLQENFNAISFTFFVTMDKQIEDWSSCFRSLDINQCLQNFSRFSELGLSSKAVSTAQLLQSNAKSKSQRIVCFIVNLRDVLQCLIEKYLTRYGLRDWAGKKEIMLQTLHEKLLEAYQLHCRFFHCKLLARIRYSLDSTVNTDQQGQMLDSCLINNMQNAAKTEVTRVFQEVYRMHDEYFFQTEKREDVWFLYKEVKDRRAYYQSLQFLQPENQKALASICARQLEYCGFSSTQMQAIKTIISKECPTLAKLIEEGSQGRDWIAIDQATNLKTLVYLKFMFESHYSGLARCFLKYVFRQLGDVTYRYSNFRVLTEIEYLLTPKSQLLKSLRAGETQSKVFLSKLMRRLKDKLEPGSSDEPPMLVLGKMGKRFRKSQTITIYISGYTCQGAPFEEFWHNLHYRGETYFMNWKSGFKDHTMVYNFDPTYQIALRTGKYLAHLIMDEIQGYAINLIGFSLGSEVIGACIRELQAHNRADVIHSVLLLGAVLNVEQSERLFRKGPFILTNCYNPNDLALNTLLGLISKRKWRPSGLEQINVMFRLIDNIMTSSIIADFKGHNVRFPDLRKRFELEYDLLYLKR